MTLAAHGYVAISINYRLVPKALHPAQLDDTQRAVRWLRHNAAKYSVDPNRLGAHGGSAGGHLVLFLGSRETRDTSAQFSKHSSKVQCVVDFFGPSDFVTDPLSANGSPIVEAFIGKKREEAPDAYRDASPITFVSKDSAPTLICHGTADMLVPMAQSERVEAALKKAGVAVTLMKMEGQPHGFRGEAQEQALKASVEFFDKYLKP
jgi:acetyl esterase/lipase